MKKISDNIITALLGAVVGVLVTLLVCKLMPQKKFDGDYSRWRKLNLILQEVQNNYVDTIDMKAMTDAAVEAALSTLDPHSIYLPPVQLTESETELSGNFEGIGIQFNVPNDTAIVLSVIPGGPSEKAGLNQGDRIISVDDRTIAGTKTPQDIMVRLMKGPSGTKVRITVNRDGTRIPFEITRDKIPVNSIDAAFMIDDATGYIKLSKFFYRFGNSFFNIFFLFGISHYKKNIFQILCYFTPFLLIYIHKSNLVAFLMKLMHTSITYTCRTSCNKYNFIHNIVSFLLFITKPLKLI